MWRRQFLNSLPLFAAQQPVQESRTIDELNSYIRVLRKKEDVYFKLCDIGKRTDEQIDVQMHSGLLRKEAERVQEQEQGLLRSIESTQPQSKDNKTAMYSLLSRILESLEVTKQRLRMLDERHTSNIEAQKRQILDFYNQQVYLGNYDICLLIGEASQRSNQRIAAQLAPLLRRPSALQGLTNLPAVPRPDQLSPLKKKSLSQSSMRSNTTTTRDPFRMTPNLLDIIASRKLKTRSRKKLTEDPSPSKTKKPRPKKIYERLYGILDARNIYIDPMYLQAEYIDDFEAKLLEMAFKRNEQIRKGLDDYQQQHSQWQRTRQEKAYRIRARKIRSDEGWVPVSSDQLSRL